VKIESSSLSLVVDTYAWIEYFRGTKKGEVVKNYLLSSSSIYTPSIVLAEVAVARKYIREGVPSDMVKERLRAITSISAIVHIDAELALKAGETYLELLKHAKSSSSNRGQASTTP